MAFAARRGDGSLPSSTSQDSHRLRRGDVRGSHPEGASVRCTMGFIQLFHHLPTHSCTLFHASRRVSRRVSRREPLTRHGQVRKPIQEAWHTALVLPMVAPPPAPAATSGRVPRADCRPRGLRPHPRRRRAFSPSSGRCCRRRPSSCAARRRVCACRSVIGATTSASPPPGRARASSCLCPRRRALPPHAETVACSPHTAAPRRPGAGSLRELRTVARGRGQLGSGVLKLRVPLGSPDMLALFTMCSDHTGPQPRSPKPATAASPHDVTRGLPNHWRRE